MTTALDLAAIFELWASAERHDADVALDNDEIGKAARLRGRAEGLTLAAAEVRRLQP